MNKITLTIPKDTILRALVVWFVISSIGTIVILLVPEDVFGAAAIIRLSGSHAPSLIDMVGIVCVIVSWVYYLAAVSKHYLAMRRPAEHTLFYSVLVVLLAATLICVFQDLPYYLWFIMGALTWQIGVGVRLARHPYKLD